MAGTEFPRLNPVGVGNYDQSPVSLPKAPIEKPASGVNPFNTGASNPNDAPDLFKRFRPESTPQASPVGAPGGINTQF